MSGRPESQWIRETVRRGSAWGWCLRLGGTCVQGRGLQERRGFRGSLAGGRWRSRLPAAAPPLLLCNRS